MTQAKRLKRQHAAFLAGVLLLRSELERVDFFRDVPQDDDLWRRVTERSKTSKLTIAGFGGSLIIYMERPDVPMLAVLGRVIRFGPADLNPPGLVLTDQEFDALFDAFVDEFRCFFQKHGIRPSGAAKEFFDFTR